MNDPVSSEDFEGILRPLIEDAYQTAMDDGVLDPLDDGGVSRRSFTAGFRAGWTASNFLDRDGEG